jgi:uncharacterized protein YaaN involved in tellurite resistance
MSEQVEPYPSAPPAPVWVEVGAPGTPAASFRPGGLGAPAAPADGAALAADELLEVKALRDALDLSSRDTVRHFGADQESALTVLAQELLQVIEARTLPAASARLSQARELIAELGAGQSGDALAGEKPHSAAFRQVLQELETRHQRLWVALEGLLQEMQQDRRNLRENLARTEQLHHGFLRQLRRLDLCLLAGEDFLSETLRWSLPGMEAETASWGDPLSGRTLEDFRRALGSLQERLRRLKRTQVLSVQVAQQVRLLQRADESLRERLSSSAAATVPFWMSQVSAALNRRRAGDVEEGFELLDPESLRQADESLQAGLEEAIRLQAQADLSRGQALAELLRLQEALQAPWRS